MTTFPIENVLVPGALPALHRTVPPSVSHVHRVHLSPRPFQVFECVDVSTLTRSISNLSPVIFSPEPLNLDRLRCSPDADDGDFGNFGNFGRMEVMVHELDNRQQPLIYARHKCKT